MSSDPTGYTSCDLTTGGPVKNFILIQVSIHNINRSDPHSLGEGLPSKPTNTPSVSTSVIGVCVVPSPPSYCNGNLYLYSDSDPPPESLCGEVIGKKRHPDKDQNSRP